MSHADLRRHLEDLRNGAQSVDEVLDFLRDLPFQDLGFAKLDHHRPLRTGFPEVVLGKGKNPQQVSQIVSAMAGRGSPVLVTKTDLSTYQEVLQRTPGAIFNKLAGAIVVPHSNSNAKRPGVLIVTAGTADLPTAEEAAITVELMGNEVARINDVGVAGLPRLLQAIPALRRAQVIVVVAGMEAALVGAVAGLVSAPIIAVPVSTGYGASFSGLAALLSMMNSCAPGVAVVNIDNGFGAGYFAAQINQMAWSSIE